MLTVSLLTHEENGRSPHGPEIYVLYIYRYFESDSDKIMFIDPCNNGF